MMAAGQEFIKLVNKNVLTEISHAMNSLHTDLLDIEAGEAKEIFEQMTEYLRKTINVYIDAQKEAFLKLISIS